MKVVFFSDAHGNKYAVDAFFEAMILENPEKIIFCGDVFGYYYYQNEIIDMLRQKKVTTLLGNHDNYFLELLSKQICEYDLIEKYGNSYSGIVKKISYDNICFLKSLKSKYEFEVDNIKIGVFHGSPEDPLNGRVYPDTIIDEIQEYSKYDYVILGHTHHKMEKKIGDTIVLNPGSIGQQRDGKGCSYLVLDTIKREHYFKLIDYNLEQLMIDIEKYDSGNFKLKEVLLRKVEK